MSRYLVDKSALARMRHPTVAARLGPIIEEGLACSCGLIDLEVLYSAKNQRELDRIAARRALAYDHIPMTEDHVTRALEVQRELAKRGQHRRPIPDLLIAAIAERSDLTVLHYDRDFDLIASVTQQRVEWVVPAGSVS